MFGIDAGIIFILLQYTIPRPWGSEVGKALRGTLPTLIRLSPSCFARFGLVLPGLAGFAPNMLAHSGICIYIYIYIIFL